MSALFAIIAALAIQPSPDPDLTRTVAARDAELFDVMFQRCDPAALADLVSEDLEFYHDRGGAMIGRDVFVDDYRRSCEARTPDDWRSRRELVPGTLLVQAIPGVGAVAEGAHLFYEHQGSGPEHLAGRARFAVLWRHEADGQWRLARAFSLSHEAAEAP